MLISSPPSARSIASAARNTATPQTPAPTPAGCISSHLLRHIRREQFPNRVVQQAVGEVIDVHAVQPAPAHIQRRRRLRIAQDRKSTRLNSNHGSISYAVF